MASTKHAISDATVVPVERIESRIYLLRGEKVILDFDLAELYGVAAKVLNQTVRRNQERFPADFMFQLTAQEFVNLRSQFVTSSSSYGGRRYAPYAFSEPVLSPKRTKPKAPKPAVKVAAA